MAQVDYYLKIDGIDGESDAKGVEKQIDIESWSWSESNGAALSGGGMGAGKVSLSDCSFGMRCCAATPKLMLACATGEHIKSAVLTCRKAGKDQQDFMKITFSDIIVSSYSTGGSKGDVVPVDHFSIAFSVIEFEYKPQKPDGTLGGAVKAGFDAKKVAKK
jgi:type VI secretion system secreted protein Hcp